MGPWHPVTMDVRDGAIETPRTRLVLMSLGFMDAILAGDREGAEALLGASVPDEWPDEDDRWLLRLRNEQIREDASSAPWLVRAIVSREADRMVGHVGFHGPPDEDRVVEIGYTVLSDFRRRGYAEEAVRAMFDWAHSEHEIARLRASAAPDNDPSLALIKKLGFFQVGVQWDERDGRELVFEANYPLRD